MNPFKRFNAPAVVRVATAAAVVVLALWSPTRSHQLPPTSPWTRLEAAARLGTDTLHMMVGHPVSLTGFMLPLDTGRQQSHFLLSAYPLTCGYCVAGGPGSLVEVFAREPVGYTEAQLVVEGEFRLHPRSSEGLLFQLHDAAASPLQEGP